MASYNQVHVDRDGSPRRHYSTPADDDIPRLGEAHFTTKELQELGYTFLGRKNHQTMPAANEGAQGSARTQVLLVLLAIFTAIVTLCSAEAFIQGGMGICLGGCRQTSAGGGAAIFSGLWRRDSLTPATTDTLIPVATPFLGHIRPVFAESHDAATDKTTTTETAPVPTITSKSTATMIVSTQTALFSSSATSTPVTAKYSPTTKLIKPTLGEAKTALFSAEDNIVMVTVTSVAVVTDSQLTATVNQHPAGGILTGSTAKQGLPGFTSGIFFNTTVTGTHTVTIRRTSAATALSSSAAALTRSSTTMESSLADISAGPSSLSLSSPMPTKFPTISLEGVPTVNIITETASSDATVAACSCKTTTTVMLAPSAPAKHTMAEVYGNAPPMLATPSAGETPDDIISDIIASSTQAASRPSIEINILTDIINASIYTPAASTTSVSSVSPDAILPDILGGPHRHTQLQAASVTREEITTIAGPIPSMSTATEVDVLTETVVMLTSLHPVDGNIYWVTETLTGTGQPTTIMTASGAGGVSIAAAITEPSASTTAALSVPTSPHITVTVTLRPKLPHTTDGAPILASQSQIPTLVTATRQLNSTRIETVTVSESHTNVFTKTVSWSLNATMSSSYSRSTSMTTVSPTATVTLGAPHSHDLPTAHHTLEWPTATQLPTVQDGAGASKAVSVVIVGLALFGALMAVLN